MKDKSNGKPSEKADFTEYESLLLADSVASRKQKVSMDNLLFIIRFLAIIVIAFVVVFLLVTLILHLFSPWKWLDENALQTAKQTLQYLGTAGISIVIGRFRLVDRLVFPHSDSAVESPHSSPSED